MDSGTLIAQAPVYLGIGVTIWSTLRGQRKIRNNIQEVKDNVETVHRNVNSAAERLAASNADTVAALTKTVQTQAEKGQG